MNKILTVNQVGKVVYKLKQQGKRIVLAGGCFDILHIGHIAFLEKAKSMGDILVLLLESDEAIKSLKGIKRPINPQMNRAKILGAIEFVDLIVLLSKPFKTFDYDKLVEKISPDIIAVTGADPSLSQKKAQAKKSGGVVKVVLKKIPEHSTTKLWKLLNEI